MNEINVKQNLGTLEFNFKELDKQIEEYVNKYKDLVINEEQVKSSKKIRADLNSTAKELNDKKIKVKKEFLEPYTKFESKVKQIILKITNVSDNINNQIKKYEQETKDNKQKEIKDYFIQEVDRKYINFDLIMDTKWLNASVSITQWKQEMENKVAEVDVNLKVIGQEKNILRAIYLKTLNLTQAYAEYEALQAEQKKLEDSETDVSVNTKETVIDEETGELVEAEVKKETRSLLLINITNIEYENLCYYLNKNKINFKEK
jgi:hypothetical protein